MNRIINLLNQKNHFLEKFYSLNETELVQFTNGNFDQLENFYQSREKILDIIKYLDSEVDACQKQDLVPDEDARREVLALLTIKDEYVNRILGQDLEILSCIENAKSNIIRELQDIRKNRKVVGSYKSKTFQRRLDEEA